MHSVCNFKNLGINEDIEKEFETFKEKYSLGRVAGEYKGLYKIYHEYGESLGSVPGKMMYTATSREDFPAVGDWVIIDNVNSDDERTIIRGILKRKSIFARKVAGRVIEEQIIAVNVDTAFICMALNEDFNLRRLERYITMAWDSGARPVILLTKSDLCENIDEKLSLAKECAIGIDVNCISYVDKAGLDIVKSYLKEGETMVFLGSSGVGKSTLINELLGEQRQNTKEINSIIGRGRHTTTNRDLIILPYGGIVIDTPGMREFHIMDADSGLEAAFDDVENLALKCRFSDCTHKKEPGCAVREAIENGVLNKDRYDNYVRLKKEAARIEAKLNIKAKSEEKRNQKKLSKAYERK